MTRFQWRIERINRVLDLGVFVRRTSAVLLISGLILLLVHVMPDSPA